MGNNLLVWAFIFSLGAGVLFALGAFIKNMAVLIGARLSLVLSLGFVSAATAFLVSLLVNHNFAYEYVAEYTKLGLSPLYSASALWAGNQGSLLFWAWLMALIGGLVALTGRGRGRALAPIALAVVMVTEAFLLGLMLFVKSPFTLMGVPTSDGLGLTPFFENAGMLLHPPVIMAGYACFTVPFAFALAALITGKLDDDWLASARLWALLAWLLVGAGIVLGAWWSYNVIGDGRYWHWEAVENASLMPWLTATALLHSASMQRKRGTFKVWTLALVILTFALVIFSVFLNRSDIIASIQTHATFAYGPPILWFLAASVLVATLLVVARRKALMGRSEIDSIVSKEGSFLLTNLLLLASTAAILLGTIFLVHDNQARALGASLVAPFFNRVNTPIFLLLILLAGVCITLGWRKAELKSVGRALLWPFTLSVLLVVALLASGVRGWVPLAGLAVCCFIPFTAVAEWVKSTRARSRNRKENYLKSFLGLIWADRPRHGGYIIHAALVLIAVGIVGSTTFAASQDSKLVPGASMAVGGDRLVYNKLSYEPLAGQMIFTADLSLYGGDTLLGKLSPVTYLDRSFNAEVHKAAIRSSLAGDLYVTVVGWDATGLTEFKASTYPLLPLIWVGGWLLTLGGLIAFWPAGKTKENEAD